MFSIVNIAERFVCVLLCTSKKTERKLLWSASTFNLSHNEANVREQIPIWDHMRMYGNNARCTVLDRPAVRAALNSKTHVSSAPFLSLSPIQVESETQVGLHSLDRVRRSSGDHQP